MRWAFWKKDNKNLRKTWTIRRRNASFPASYQAGGLDTGAKYVDGLKRLRAASGLKLDHEKVRKEARIAYHDSSVVRSIVGRYAMLGVGSGLFLEAQPQAEILGRSPESLTEWAFDIQRRFHLWASSKKADISESMTFYQLQRFLLQNQQRDGEYFVRLHYTPEGLKFGTFDPTQLVDGMEGRTRFDYGVHRDANGAIDKYRIRVGDNKIAVFPRYTRNGKPLILHGFMPDYSGQVRGISHIAHILQESKLLTDYQIYELIKAGLQSAINVWVKPSKDAPATNVFEGMTASAGPLAEYEESEIPAEPSAEDMDPLTYKRMDEAIAFGAGLSVVNLNAGEELKSFDSSAPNEAFSGFNKAMEDIIYPSIDMPSEIGRLSFNSNYSASQAAIFIFWEVLKTWRDELASDSLNPVYKAWLDTEIARGRIRAPGWSDPELSEAWAYCGWTGRTRPHIDPVKHAEGEKIKVELGATTQERIARETNGSNAALNRAKLKKELADMPPIPWQSGSNQSQQRDE